MSDARKRLQQLGEDARRQGLNPPPEMRDPARWPCRAFLDGWLGDSWRRRLFGTNFVRVLILPDRLVALRDPRADFFARSA